MVKKLPASARDAGSIPGWQRSPGEGNSNSLQYSCKSHGQRSLVCYSSWGRKRIGHNLSTKQQQRTYFNCSCKAILMATNSLNFSLSDKVLLSFFSFWYSHCICYNFFSYPIILEHSVLVWGLLGFFSPIFVLSAFQI